MGWFVYDFYPWVRIGYLPRVSAAKEWQISYSNRVEPSCTEQSRTELNRTIEQGWTEASQTKLNQTELNQTESNLVEPNRVDICFNHVVSMLHKRRHAIYLYWRAYVTQAETWNSPLLKSRGTVSVQPHSLPFLYLKY